MAPGHNMYMARGNRESVAKDNYRIVLEEKMTNSETSAKRAVDEIGVLGLVDR